MTPAAGDGRTTDDVALTTTSDGAGGRDGALAVIRVAVSASDVSAISDTGNLPTTAVAAWPGGVEADVGTVRIGIGEQPPDALTCFRRRSSCNAACRSSDATAKGAHHGNVLAPIAAALSNAPPDKGANDADEDAEDGRDDAPLAGGGEAW